MRLSGRAEILENCEKARIDDCRRYCLLFYSRANRVRIGGVEVVSIDEIGIVKWLIGRKVRESCRLFKNACINTLWRLVKPLFKLHLDLTDWCIILG